MKRLFWPVWIWIIAFSAMSQENGVPPSISTPPLSQTVQEGANVSLSVAASGSGPISFQWRLNGTDILGATSTSLALANVDAGRSGTYTVKVSNPEGSIISPGAVLIVSVSQPGKIYFQNSVWHRLIDAPISFGPGGPAAEGRIDGSNAISSDGLTWGGTNARAMLYAGSAGSTEQQMVPLLPAVEFGTSTLAGYITSSTTPLVVPHLRAIEPAVVQIRVWDTGDSPLNTYEDAVEISATRAVYLGKSPIVTVPALGGATTPIITPPSMLVGLQSFTANYLFLGASNLSSGPIIISQPPSQSVFQGVTVTFAVGAAGAPPFQFQWRLNDLPIVGATNASLILTNVTIARSGSYSVLVSNAVGYVQSREATLFVNTVDTAFAGQIMLNNISGVAGINAPISFSSGGPAPAGRINGTNAIKIGPYTWGGINAFARLYAGPAGSREEDLIPTIPYAGEPLRTGFRTNTYAGFLAVGTRPTRYVLNVPAGYPAVAQIRVWDAGDPNVTSFEEALAISQYRGVYLGKSALVNLAQVTAMPSTPAPLVGLTAFDISYTQFGGTPPSLAIPPLSQQVLEGATVVFQVDAIGATPLSYQWWRDGNEILGATNASLVLSNVQWLDRGSYSVEVVNNYGSVRSEEAGLEVCRSPMFAPGAERPIQLRVVRPNGANLLEFVATPGKFCQIQASTNLVNWDTVYETTTGADGTIQYVPPTSSDSKNFYRVISP